MKLCPKCGCVMLRLRDMKGHGIEEWVCLNYECKKDGKVTVITHASTHPVTGTVQIMKEKEK